ncbi:MAG: cytochrome-ba3 oxidase subunit [Haloarculaceae archaeon]
MERVPTNWLAALALLALIPVAVYLLDQSATIAVLGFVNVSLLAGALYLFLGPAREESTATH